jgi:Domain of unknown function (DUF1840)
MLYKFKSKASGDVIMFEAHAKILLEIMGKDPSAKGILLVDDMPLALAALERALAEQQDKEDRHKSQVHHGSTEQKGGIPGVGLRQRATPLKRMIMQCIKEGHPIVWGV